MVKIKNLCLSFGDKVILNGFDLELPGGVTALTGPSGCGKTTLLRVLAGLQAPDSGAVVGMDPARSVILFQENRLLPHPDTIGQITAVLPRSRRAEAAKWLEFVELAGEEHTPVHKLSGGMQRRLALARALALGGQWLLLDEPFTGVDAPRAARILERIKALHLNVLLTTHEHELLEHCDRVIPLDGPPLTVL